MQEEGKKKGSSKNIFHIAVSRNDRFEAFIFLKILLFEVSKSLWNVKLCPLWANEVLITRFVKDKVCNTYSLFYWANLLASFFSLLLFYSGKEFQFIREHKETNGNDSCLHFTFRECVGWSSFSRSLVYFSSSILTMFLKSETLNANGLNA